MSPGSLNVDEESLAVGPERRPSELIVGGRREVARLVVPFGVGREVEQLPVPRQFLTNLWPRWRCPRSRAERFVAAMDARVDIATSGAALRTEDITVRYGGRLGLFDVTVAFVDRAIIAVTGPSGSGKSTLLRAARTGHT